MSMETERTTAGTMPSNDIPTLTWRDGIFSCFRHGLCHNFCCMVYWCPYVALGQLLTRMNLTFLAQPATSDVEAQRSFFYNIYLTAALLCWGCCAYTVLFSAAVAVGAPTNEGNGIDDESSTDDSASPFAVIVNILTWLLYTIAPIYLLYASCTLRRHVRHRYSIPATSCPEGCDDCCCVFWCGSCSLCQIGRHTVNYDVFPSACCTPTGLPAHHPGLVV